MKVGLALLGVVAVGLAGCVHRHVRVGAAPSGARFVIGQPYFAGGEWHYPRAVGDYDRTGLAMVVAPGHEAATSDGEAFHQNGLMAQSPVLPLPSLVRVTDLANGNSLVLRVNDRGPAVAGRVIAVTRKAAALLGFPAGGVVEVRVTLLARRSAAVQTALGAGPHLTAAPVTGVVATALPPPAGAAGAAGFVAAPARPVPAINATPVVGVSGVVRRGPADPGPLYVEMAGFGAAGDARALLDRLAPMAGMVVPENRGGRRLYAVALGPYGSVAAADEALRGVLRRGVADPEIVVR